MNLYKELVDEKTGEKTYLLGRYNDTSIYLNLSDKYVRISTKKNNKCSKWDVVNVTLLVIQSTILNDISRSYNAEHDTFRWQIGKPEISKSEYIHYWFNLIFKNSIDGYYTAELQKRLNLNDKETNTIGDIIEHILKKYLCSVIDDGLIKFLKVSQFDE